MMRMTRLFWLLAALALGGCAAGTGEDAAEADRRGIAELTRGILALGEGVDPEEAARAARIAFAYTRQLAREYEITDPPIVHNTKVNMGLRPRGLCWHWAEDMEARLLREEFRTLDLHRAIAPPRALRLEHSTAVIGARGDSLFDGIVLDPWRTGGRMFWIPLREDSRYDWRPRSEVLAARTPIPVPVRGAAAR